MAGKRPHLKKKSSLSSRQCTLSQFAKLHELFLALLPHPPYSPDLALSDYLLFAGKKFSSDEEVIAETEAYFKDKNKSYYKNGIEEF